VAAALLVVAEGQQRRAEHVEPHHVDELRRARGRELLVDDDLLGRRRPAPAELARPGAPDVAGRVAAGLPAAQHLDALVERVRQPARVEGRRRQEPPHLVLQPPFGFRRAESHELRSYQLY
jgi:hypothetical protein